MLSNSISHEKLSSLTIGGRQTTFSMYFYKYKAKFCKYFFLQYAECDTLLNKSGTDAYWMEITYV